MNGEAVTSLRGDLSNLPTRIDMRSILTREHFERERERSSCPDLGWSSGDIEDTFPMERFEFVKL